jgi:hypothetical protein
MAFTRLALTAKCGAADDHPDQHAGDEARLQNEQGYGKERCVFEQGNPSRRVNQPLIDELGAEIEQERPQHEFGHVGEEAGIDGEHEHRDGCHGQAGQASAASGHVIERGSVQGDRAHIAAERRGSQIGDADRRQLALEVGFALGHEFDSGRI